MKIKLHNSLDSPETVLVTTDCSEARDDQSIEGTRWECDGELGYALIDARPGLVGDLREQGYEVDDSEYRAPGPNGVSVFPMELVPEQHAVAIEVWDRGRTLGMVWLRGRRVAGWSRDPATDSVHVLERGGQNRQWRGTGLQDTIKRVVLELGLLP